MTKEEHAKRRFARLTPPALVVAAFLATLSSCNLLNQPTVVQPATISACISGFGNAYSSGNDSVLYQYFSVNTSQYNQIKPATYWDSTPFYSGYSPQPLTGVSQTSSTTVTATFSNNSGGSYTFTATMENDGGYWYILSLSLDQGGSPLFSIS